jgi:hypothetical protein
MINAPPPALRDQASKIERLRPELYRLLAAPAAVGFIIGWIGADGERRFASACIWTILSVAGWLLNDLFTRPFVAPLHRRRYPLAAVLLAGFIVSAPLSILLNFSFGEIFRFWGIQRNGLDALATMSVGHMVSSAFAPAVLWVGINLVASCSNGGMLFGHLWSGAAERAPQPAPQLSVKTAQPAFLAKVRPALRGRVIAINAELHYVRVFTDRGEDLIHYRFCDAVADMEALGGLQVHRSWCVSVEEIVLRRAQSVELRSGLSVPVGRVYKRALLRLNSSKALSSFDDCPGRDPDREFAWLQLQRPFCP